MTHSVLVLVGGILAWLGWHLFHELAGELLEVLLRPITRPLWRAIVRARWPWPLLIGLLGGVAGMGVGIASMGSLGWRGSAGVILFFSGAALALMAPLLWRDARQQALVERKGESRPVV